ncbi:hypothetical protein PAXRUDRAFT_166733 [Paxillus rubicundulus Ve08.2h10]|uniref:Uncharacterized protein n=1 Tax=Paxillus rubicundulus Ve08.2h10 TaxID=930991 RepID=A0A0D0DHI1_9AGAM|nr:hypothetical protein PAXRUDRAFT_166733 [Paxillus rubicundulus Ve08.2h10]
MAYAIELDNGTIIEVLDLATDESNWKTYHNYILHVVEIKGLIQQYNGTDTKPIDTTVHELKA